MTSSALFMMEVSDASLAEIAGCTSRRIRQLAESGKLKRVGRNKFILGDAVRVLLEEAAENNEGSEIQKEKLRKLRAEATMAELELAKQIEEVALVSEFERAWGNRYGMIRVRVLNVVQRVIPAIIGETKEDRIRATLTKELRDALTSAANEEMQEEDLIEEELETDE